MRHHEKHIGLQEHSIGELYPWSVRAHGGRGPGVGRLDAFHCITGEVGPCWHYSPSGLLFETAHKSCEDWARDRIAEDAAKEIPAGETGYVDICPHCGNRLD